MSILIMEPHADDVLLSCPELLMSHEQVTVVTFHDDLDRPVKRYSEFFGNHITTIQLDCQEIHMRHAAEYRTNPQRFPLYEMLDRYHQLIENMIADSDHVYFPWGIEHPHHCAVASWLYNTPFKNEVLYYLDRPYWDVQAQLAWRPYPQREMTVIKTPELDRGKLVSLIFPGHGITNSDKILDSRYF